MNMNDITQLIGSVGFPIAACCVMFFQQNKLQETLTHLTATLQTMSDRINDIEQSIKKKED